MFDITITSKTQAYMAEGKPLLMAFKGEVAALVNLAQCELPVEPENPKDLANTIDAMALMPTDEMKTMGGTRAVFTARPSA